MRALAAAVAVVLTAFAGCTSGGGEAPISFRAPADPATEPFRFTAGVDADTYEWRFGDGRAPQTGKEVEHVFGVSSGTFTVSLRATKDGEPQDHTQQVRIGAGTNAPGAFVLEVGTDWAVTGEAVRFSGAASTDPEGDPILVSWLCSFQGELVLAGGDHGHGGDPGVPFVPPAQSGIEARVANGTLPAPDRVVEGDFCENLRGDGAFSEATTVEGAFSKPGLYRVTMLAKDPANTFVNGFYDLIVSAPADRPAPAFNHSFSGTLQGGAGGGLQDVGDEAGAGQTLDRATHTFHLDLPAERLAVGFEHGENGVNEATWTLRKGSTVLTQGDGSVELADPTTLVSGDYTLEVVLEVGVQATYAFEVSGTYAMDPRLKYDLH